MTKFKDIYIFLSLANDIESIDLYRILTYRDWCDAVDTALFHFSCIARIITPIYLNVAYNTANYNFEILLEGNLITRKRHSKMITIHFITFTSQRIFPISNYNR